MIGNSRRTSSSRQAIRLTIFILYGCISHTLATAYHAPQGTSPAQLPPGVEVKIQAQPLKATVGDPIQINLDFTLPRGYQLQFPQLPTQVGEFSVLDGPAVPPQQASGKAPSSPPPATGTRDSGMLHQRARIVVAVYKTGEFDFPTLPFVLRDPVGKSVEVSSPPVKIRIESILDEKDLSLKDLKKQAEIEEPVRSLFWFALGGAALALTLGAWWWVKRRRRPAFIPSVQYDVDPLDLAEANLRDLIGRGLLEKGLVKQFYVHLSDITKKALEAGYGIQTVEKTTLEIVSALSIAPGADAARIEPASLEPIETLLLSCDIVKFARYVPSRAENDEAVTRAFGILADCRTRRQSAVPGAAPVGGGA